MELAELKSTVDRGAGALSVAKADLARATTDLSGLMTQKETILLAQALVQDTAKDTQDQLRYHLQDLVNTALTSVFPGVYDFHIDFEVARGSTSADIWLSKDGTRIDPLTSTGGGVVDVVAFALRLVAWSLSHTDNVIVLDEPFKFLSMGLRPLAGELLSKLSKQLGLQIIYVTHDPELVGVADRIFEVTIKNGVSQITAKEGQGY